mmetsp:Transcript_6893/g.8937  ORF Transcript_6893/g.8937 Transcript_6893/m.8937 type:complete len:167 (-) Transcript_6893:161-661(-)
MLSRFTTSSAVRQKVTNVAQRALLSTAATPSVHDLLINLTIVDPSGARKKIKGLIGKTLYENCEMHGIDLGPASISGKWETRRSETWLEPTFGEGACAGFDHVVLTGKGASAVCHPVSRPEQFMLNDYWDETDLYEGSRLASNVWLNKEMEGMVVFVPDRLEDDCP